MRLRILALFKKELLQLLRDRKTLPLVLIVPVFQLILFGYVAGSDLRNIKFAVYDQDQSRASREMVAQIEHSGFFINRGTVSGYQQLETALDSGAIRIGLVVPPGFERQMTAMQRPALQVLIDGSDSNTAAIAQNYFISIINNQSRRIILGRLKKMNVSSAAFEGIDHRYRVYYNPELRNVNFMVPGITVIILLLTTTMLTALSIVKEKELGTIEQIMVTPIRRSEFILGKLLPFPIIGFIDVILVIVIGSLWFAIPIKGSLTLLFGASGLFLLTTLGMGLFISSVSATQQQAMLSTVFFLIPNILLSGFVFPIINMPPVLQYLTYLIPGRYFIEIIRGIYLKGIGFSALYPQLLALFIFGLVILTVSARNFRKQMT